MGLDCKITVLGHGTTKGSRNGRPKNDQTRPVHGFICGSDVYYKAVLKHIRECSKCDPQEALEAYISDRKRPKFGGVTSAGLIELSQKYAKHFPGRIDAKTLREFKWRIGTLGGLASMASQLTSEELVAGARLMYVQWTMGVHYSASPDNVRDELRKLRQDRHPYYAFFEAVWTIRASDAKQLPTDNDDLLNLATVACVLGG